MLIDNLYESGKRLVLLRRQAGLTQAQIAEIAGLADRTYADIERGTTSMRLDTLLRICRALHITPDEILTSEPKESIVRGYDMIARLQKYPERVQKAAYDMIEIYLDSID